MPWVKGAPRSEETKAKMRAAHAGRAGRPQTEATKEKIRQARAAREALKPPKPPKVRRPRGWRWTEEQKARLSEKAKGRVVSEETKAKLRAIRKAEWDRMDETERALRIATLQVREAGVTDPRRHYARRPSGDCRKCNTWRRTLHRDHVIPRWKGGSDEPSNIQWICANCHEDKTRQDMIGFPSPMKGRKHSEESKRRMSESGKKRTSR